MTSSRSLVLLLLALGLLLTSWVTGFHRSAAFLYATKTSITTSTTTTTTSSLLLLCDRHRGRYGSMSLTQRQQQQQQVQPWWILASSSSSLLLSSSSSIEDGTQVVVANSSTPKENLVSLTLTKPLGIILEELQEEQAAGVFVLEVKESGSAWPYRDQIQGMQIASVMQQNLRKATFDQVMDAIGSGPESGIQIEFEPPIVAGGSSATQGSMNKSTSDTTKDEYLIGTTVTLTIEQKGKETQIIQGKVGDNLRKTLIDNGVEVYQGMRQTLGNCGGAGQCTFCAFDFMQHHGWTERSDYENSKLKRFPKARLTCLSNILGPATIIKTER